MHVLVATAGVLPPEPVAELAEHLVGESGMVSVVSAIEVPREFLAMVRAEEWRPLREGEPGWPADEEALTARYVEERGKRLVEPVLTALEGRGIPCRAVFLEADDPAAAIVSAAEELEADLIMLGATRSLFDEASWRSVSHSVINESRRPVVVIPPRQRVALPEA